MEKIVCTLGTGDRAARLADWQAVLAEATGREDSDEGVAVRFDHDADRTVRLAGLIAAEYACCSFASYHLTVDSHGVRLEIRTPPEARGAFAGLFELAAVEPGKH
jgi:hypothetical protein